MICEIVGQAYSSGGRVEMRDRWGSSKGMVVLRMGRDGVWGCWCDEVNRSEGHVGGKERKGGRIAESRQRFERKRGSHEVDRGEAGECTFLLMRDALCGLLRFGAPVAEGVHPLYFLHGQILEIGC